MLFMVPNRVGISCHQYGVRNRKLTNFGIFCGSLIHSRHRSGETIMASDRKPAACSFTQYLTIYIL